MRLMRESLDQSSNAISQKGSWEATASLEGARICWRQRHLMSEGQLERIKDCRSCLTGATGDALPCDWCLLLMLLLMLLRRQVILSWPEKIKLTWHMGLWSFYRQVKPGIFSNMTSGRGQPVFGKSQLSVTRTHFSRVLIDDTAETARSLLPQQWSNNCNSSHPFLSWGLAEPAGPQSLAGPANPAVKAATIGWLN